MRTRTNKPGVWHPAPTSRPGKGTHREGRLNPSRIVGLWPRWREGACGVTQAGGEEQEIGRGRLRGTQLGEMEEGHKANLR